MKFKRHIQIQKGRIDLTPLIDVVLLLLIFFMLTSSFIIQPSISVNLPRAVTGKSLQARRVEIYITAEDIVYIYGSAVTISDLKDTLSEISEENMGIIIQADRAASLGKVVQIWDVCRELGIRQIDLATTTLE